MIETPKKICSPQMSTYLSGRIGVAFLRLESGGATYLRQELWESVRVIVVSGWSLRSLLLLFLLLLRRSLRSEIVPPSQYPHHNVRSR